jgi:hypothetical protein
MLVFAPAWAPEQVAMTLLTIMVLSLVGVLVHGLVVLRRM